MHIAICFTKCCAIKQVWRKYLEIADDSPVGPMQPQLPACDARKATEQKVRIGLHEMLWRTGGEGLLEQVD